MTIKDFLCFYKQGCSEDDLDRIDIHHNESVDYFYNFEKVVKKYKKYDVLSWSISKESEEWPSDFEESSAITKIILNINI